MGNVKGPGGELPLPALYSQEGADVAVPQDNHDKQLPQFFAKVDQIKELLTGIRSIQKEIIIDNDASRQATRRQDIVVIRDRMQSNVNRVSREALNIKKRLEQLEVDNTIAQRQPQCERGSSSERIRSVTINALRQKLAELMNEFQALNTRIKAQYKETVARRVYTVTGVEPKSEDMERMIETGDGERVFQRAIQELGRGQVQDTMVEIRERHDAVRELERSLLDLHQIFMDMAVLVEAQGEMLDNIENQVARAVDYVESGTTALVYAKKSQKSSRKMMCCILITVLIICGIIAGIVAWQVTKK